jgi:hypothetical protein
MRFRNLVLLLSLVGISVAQESVTTSAMTHEERVVRAAYANLTSAAQVGILWHAIELPEGKAKFGDRAGVNDAMNKQLHFELTDFKVGDLKQISRASSSFLVTGPVSRLRVEYHELPIEKVAGENNETFNLVYADVSLNIPSESPHGSSNQVRNQKSSSVELFVHALRQPKGVGEWARYASYSVLARLGERSISYRATFLFSGQGASEEVLPLDYATAMKIAPFVSVDVCPAAVATSLFNGMTGAGGWILEHNACRCSKAHAKQAFRVRDGAFQRMTSPTYSVAADVNFATDGSGRFESDGKTIAAFRDFTSGVKDGTRLLRPKLGTWLEQGPAGSASLTAPSR